MKSIYLFENYKEFIEQELKRKGRGGYGQMRRLADFLGVHSTLISQILRGSKDLSLEHAALTAVFLGLSNQETDYFLSLVQWARAGNTELKKVIKRHLDSQLKHGKQLSARIHKNTEISEEIRSIFYSDWIYSAIRQLLLLPGMWSIEKIATRLDVRPTVVKDALQFLIQSGLVIESEGEYKIGPPATHLSASSPWARTHHLNWRHKAIGQMTQRREEDLFVSCPMTLSQSESNEIRELLIKTVQDIFLKVDASPSEALCCLNLDWFHVTRNTQ